MNMCAIRRYLRNVTISGHAYVHFEGVPVGRDRHVGVSMSGSLKLISHEIIVEVFEPV